MRIGRLGLLGLATLVAACEEKPPAAYRVGGTVSGLSGGELLLQLNGQQSVTRSENGPFSFGTPLKEGSDYVVTVASAPVEQECAVEGGTGRVAGADVSSIQVRCGTRTYTLGGTVEGLRGTLGLSLGGETLQVTATGAFTFTTKLPRGGAYTVGVATQPAGQRCTVSNATGTVAGDVTNLSVRCVDWYTLDTHQAASVVIGQKDFTSGFPHQADIAGANTLDGPWGNPVLANGRLYVSDQNSSRVLGFTGVPAANDASAAFVLGQPDFTHTGENPGQGGLRRPTGLSTDGTRLAVVDSRNHRVLLYPSLPASTGAMPTGVLGQQDFAATGNACDARSLFLPEGAFIGHGKVLVADSANNRVLIWNSTPTTNGAPADLVLGQRSFTTCTPNDSTGDGTMDATSSASTLFSPTGVWTDGIRLAVVDTANNRVLLWNSFPTGNGQAADLVLGQPGFTSRDTATTATGLRIPSYIASTGLQLFVADSQNHRVLVWNQFPTTSGVAADVVLGQPNLTSADAPSPPTANGFSQPAGILLAWPQVVVPDAGNNRVLVFTSR
ncbi:MAG TPA: NHL repeat-containing protein [Archangium sp.]|uniref:NHL repeat-containing protein n=1 Tax=Archangium sp. TaxID=1872627 RepID=UPI002E2F6E51|nr:NHL repeat-containing protein [Archangium sp.]HEX5754644.1 NHL repeat-containing protein [Archangium sp.]